MTGTLPDPVLVVLVGTAGSGKATWAAGRYRAVAVVSSDALRQVVGSGGTDLEASADAFEVLERVVSARLRRQLTVVLDTLGLDPARRIGWLQQARPRGIPAVAALLETPDAVCRLRNSHRDQPVPASCWGPSRGGCGRSRPSSLPGAGTSSARWSTATPVHTRTLTPGAPATTSPDVHAVHAVGAPPTPAGPRRQDHRGRVRPAHPGVAGRLADGCDVPADERLPARIDVERLAPVLAALRA